MTEQPLSLRRLRSRRRQKIEASPVADAADTTAPGTAPSPVAAATCDGPIEPDPTRDAVLAALGSVWDPELGLDVVSLGLIYDVRAEGDLIDIDMTLTTPGCPVSEQLPVEVETAVRIALPGSDVMVNVVWEPAWTPERITPEGLHQLGFEPRS